MDDCSLRAGFWTRPDAPRRGARHASQAGAGRSRGAGGFYTRRKAMFLKAKGVGSDITRFLTLGTDFTVNSIQDLVGQVQGSCNNGDLQELVLYTHGTNGSWSLGDDQVGGIMTTDQFNIAMDKFGLLWPYFSGQNPTGRSRLILCICEAGRNPDFLVALATAIGEPVYACDGDVRPTLGLGYGWWSGNTIEALPDSGGRWSQVSDIPEPPASFS
jgi:hypothetical protein